MAAGTDPVAVQRSHAHIAKHLPRIVAQYMGREARQLPRGNWIVDAIRPPARRIELLNPAVQDGGNVPENCEYPWPAPEGSITAPADHPFAFTLLFEKAGVTLLKVMRQSAADLQR